MNKTAILDRIRAELRGLFLTFCIVLAATAVIAFLIYEAALTRGTIIYLIPVLIAAIRWGIVAALFASVCGVVASAYLFFQPAYSFEIRDPQEFVNLSLYIFTAVIVGQLAARLRQQLEFARQRETDLSDLYAFSRRLATAFDISEIHSAIESHLATIMQRPVVLFGGSGAMDDTAANNEIHKKAAVPSPVLAKAADITASRDTASIGTTVAIDNGDVWLIRAVSRKSPEFGVIAVNLGRVSGEDADDLRTRVDAVLADATATLDRLDVARAINEARMRTQTDQLREALIGSVSHELRTPIASIIGAATVLSAAPALRNEKKLQALVHDMRDEAERLNNDIQNLLDATRISSNGINPHVEWADPEDIVNSAIDRCHRRLSGHRLVRNISGDLPLVHVDSVLIKQALVQLLDNAVKYSEPGSRISLDTYACEGRIILSVTDNGMGLTQTELSQIWDRFSRGERHAARTSGFGLGLWIANAFVTANDGKMSATSDGPRLGATVSIELPVLQTATIPDMESDTHE